MSPPKAFLGAISRLARQGLPAAMRSFLWVLIVTTLVWVYADLEFTTEQDFRATLRLTTGTAENLTLVPTDEAGRNIDVTFKLKGNRTQLDTFQRWLSEHNGVLPYDVSRYEPGRSPRIENLRDALERTVHLPKRGLTFVWGDPGSFSFRLDRRIKIASIPVEFQFTGVTLASPPMVSPPKVAIYVGETAWKEIEAALPEAGRKLKTRQVDLKNLPADKPVMAEIIPSITVKPDEPPIPVEPEIETVRVEFQVQHALGTATFDVVPRVLTPATWTDDNTLAEYRLVRKPNEPWTRKITVQGAKTDVESLKAEDIDAYVVLRDDDKKPLESWLTREVIVRFPPKLKVELAPGEKPTVSFKLEKRTAPVPP